MDSLSGIIQPPFRSYSLQKVEYMYVYIHQDYVSKNCLRATKTDFMKDKKAKEPFAKETLHCTFISLRLRFSLCIYIATYIFRVV